MDKNDPLRQPLIPQADEMGQGNSALAIIGNRRVQLTEEEVRIPPNSRVSHLCPAHPSVLLVYESPELILF